MTDKTVRRIVILVLDGVGAGALPDAKHYGDEDACTLGNLAGLVHLRLPVLQRLGLGNILRMRGVPPAAEPEALPGRLAERSKGKDSTTGHWEHMGLVAKKAFPTYPDGFPAEVISAFEQAIGRPVIGNRAGSGTEFIQEFGDAHVASGRPILYTSQDSVFQLAAHVDVVPLDTLYEWCRIARRLLTGDHAVGRVIARPFDGRSGTYERTPGRKDFALEPPGPTYLDLLLKRGIPVAGVGKIGDLFAGRGFSTVIHSLGNQATLQAVHQLLQSQLHGLILANLIDFDMEWGHRNDAELFARGLAAFDRQLPGLMADLRPGDRLLITADHGCDPTTPSTDHSREYAPLLLWPRPAGTRPSAARYEGYYSDVGATAFAMFTGEQPPLEGNAIDELRPARGWQAPPRRSRPATRSRVLARAAAQSASTLRDAFDHAPAVAVVAGSGAGAIAEHRSNEADTRYVSFHELAGWPEVTVEGHAGIVASRVLGGHRLIVVGGRAHRYEGWSKEELGVPVASLARWGVRIVVAVYAAGSLSEGVGVPSLAVVKRIVDLQGGGLRRRALPLDILPSPRAGQFAVASHLAQVTYAALPGPQYETAAEVAALRGLGCEVVGMSAVAEASAAAVSGIEILPLAFVTNRAGMVGDRGDGQPTGKDLHQEVLQRAAGLTEVLRRCLIRCWPILERP